MARFFGLLAIAIGLGMAAFGSVSAQAKVRAAPTKDAPLVEKRVQLETAISTWPEKGRTAVQRMIATCGQPQEISETSIVWTVTDGRTRCNPAAAGIPPEDGGAYNVGRSDLGN